MGLPTMQNGIWVSMIGTRKIQSADTNFLTAILKMFIGAACSRYKPELANTAMAKSNTRRQNWNAQCARNEKIIQTLQWAIQCAKLL